MLFKLLISAFLLFMFMGLFSRMLDVRRILFTGLRDGDVTVWYQSSRLQQWASMDHKGGSDRSGIPFYPAEIRL